MAWYNSSWLKRKAITLTGGASGAQTDYQVKLTVTHDSDMQSDFDDLRFTKSDGVTLIDAWMESYTASTSAIIWVETDTPANTVEADIYMYYGNSGASSSWSGSNTFPDFYDGFEDGNVTEWTQSGTTEVLTAQNTTVRAGTYAGKVVYTSPGEGYEYRAITNLRDADKVIEWWWRGGGGNTPNLITLSDVLDYRDSVCLYYRPTDLEFRYYDGAYHNILTGIDNDTWYKFTMKLNANGADTKFDLWVDDVKKVTDGGTRGSAGAIDIFSFVMNNTLSGYNATIYADDILIRKYVANPATYAFGSEEDAPSVGSTMWYYALLMRRNR